MLHQEFIRAQALLPQNVNLETTRPWIRQLNEVRVFLPPAFRGAWRVEDLP